MEGLLIILNKLLLDNISTCKWKMPTNPPTAWDRNIAIVWNFHNEVLRFDNSKSIITKHTRWRNPTPPWVKINFDGAARGGTSAAGGIIKDHTSSLVATYVGKLNNHTSNQAEGMALL